MSQAIASTSAFSHERLTDRDSVGSMLDGAVAKLVKAAGS